MSGRKQEEERQARTATDEGMHTKATQERTRMVSRSVPKRSIGIMASPGEDGSTVNDEVTGSDESRVKSLQHCEHKERLIQGRSGSMPTFPLLRFARNTDVSLFVQR